MKRVLYLLVGVVLLAAGASVAAYAGEGHGNPPPTTTADDDKKVTICHATSSDTNPYVTLTISVNAVYGPGGHFNENGTTQAGHEQDYFGECKTDEPTTPTETETTPTETTPTETTPTVPETPRCPPGMTPTAGKDGKPGNDECEFPPGPPATTTTAAPPAVTAPPAATPPPVATTPAPSVTPKPVAKPKPKPKASSKVVKVEKKKHGVVKITTSDGKTHTAIMGSG